MSRIDHTFVDLDITVCGVSRTVEARVEYIHSPAFAATVERGSGVHTQLAERENTEITSITIDCAGVVVANAKPSRHNIMHLLTDEQIEAITEAILEE